MSAYVRTWDSSYQGWTARALNHAESELAKKLDANRQFTWNVYDGTQRALDTTYTNNSGYHLMVTATVHLVAKGTEWIGVEVVYDPGTAEELVIPLLERSASGITGDVGDYRPCTFPVSNGQSFQLRTRRSDASGTSTAAVDEWVEVIWDNVRPARSWSNTQTPTTAELNEWVDACDALPSNDTSTGLSVVHDETFLTNGTEYSQATMTLWALMMNAGSALGTGSIEAQVKNASDVWQRVARVEAPNMVTITANVAFLTPANKPMRMVESGIAGQTDGSSARATFAAGSSALAQFTAGETGGGTANSSTRQKFENADGRASRGVNAVRPLTRFNNTAQGLTHYRPSTQNSVDGHAIVLVAVDLPPDSGMELHIYRSTDTSWIKYLGLTNNSNSPRAKGSLLFFVPNDASYKLVATGTGGATLDARVDFMMRT